MSGMKPLHTPHGHYIVVAGRLWRAANKEALRSKDAERRAAARASVDAAKIALGERGPVWEEKARR